MFQEDPVELFRQRAFLAAPRMRFDQALVNEAIATLTACFGTEWIQSAVGRPMRGVALPFRDHPIGNILHTSGDVQIAQGLELAEYLKAAALDPNLKTVVDGLKSQFRPTLLQLAFFYRIGRLSDSDPELEAPADGGRIADISFRHEDQEYLVECYAPGARARSLDEAHWLLTKIQQAVTGVSDHYTVCVALTTLPSAAERKAVQAAISRAVQDLEADAAAGTANNELLLQEEVAVISIVRATVPIAPPPSLPARHPDFPRWDEPHMRNYLREVPRSQVTSLHPVPPPGGSVRHYAAMWLPEDHEDLPSTPDEALAALVPKLKNKLPQTKKTGSKRILIVDSWIGRHTFTPEVQAEAEASLFDQHSDVTGALIVSRTYHEAVSRHRYFITPLVNIAAKPRILSDLRDQEPALLVPADASA